MTNRVENANAQTVALDVSTTDLGRSHAVHL